MKLLTSISLIILFILAECMSPVRNFFNFNNPISGYIVYGALLASFIFCYLMMLWYRYEPRNLDENTLVYLGITFSLTAGIGIPSILYLLEGMTVQWAGLYAVLPFIGFFWLYFNPQQGGVYARMSWI